MSLLTRHSEDGPDVERTAHMDLDSVRVMSHLDEAGSMSLGELALAIGQDVPTAGRHVAVLLRDGLASGTGRVERGRAPVFYLTPRGCERLYRQRADRGPRPTVNDWSPARVEALSGYVDRLALSFDDDDPVGAATAQRAECD